MTHWTGLTPDPEGFYGFIYLITNKVSGRMYLGRKQYWSTTHKKPLKGKKRRRKVIKESDWKSYTGSSKSLNEDIQDLGMKSFRFEVILQCKTKGSLTYNEVNLQHRCEVLTSKDKNGILHFYNGNIGAVKFYPVDEITDTERAELAMKISGPLYEKERIME